MPHYFEGRRFVQDVVEISPNQRKMVKCSIFQRWDFRNAGECYCGGKGTIEVSESVGLSKKCVRSIEGAIESTLGVIGFANLKASIKANVGYEVSWEVTQSSRASFEIGPAPKCGREEMCSAPH